MRTSQPVMILIRKIRRVSIILFIPLASIFLATAVNAASFPSLKVEPVSIDFGSFVVGTSSPAQKITITNNVDATNVLTIFSIYLAGPDADSFIIQNDNCSGRILDRSISSTLEVVFKPATAGDKNAILMIPSNATVKPYEVVLHGNVIPASNNETYGPTENGSSANWPFIALMVVVALAVITGLVLASRRLIGK